jgi:hypothetical protein
MLIASGRSLEADELEYHENVQSGMYNRVSVVVGVIGYLDNRSPPCFASTKCSGILDRIFVMLQLFSQYRGGRRGRKLVAVVLLGMEFAT